MQVSIPGSGRSPGGGSGNPIQYSCLENPMDREAWWATVHGVAKIWTRLTTHTRAQGKEEGERSWGWLRILAEPLKDRGVIYWDEKHWGRNRSGHQLRALIWMHEVWGAHSSSKSCHKDIWVFVSTVQGEGRGVTEPCVWEMSHRVGKEGAGCIW